MQGVVAVEPGPGYQKDRSHRHADGPTVQRVAAVAGEQHGIDAQGGGTAEDGTDIGGIDHAVDDHDALFGAFGEGAEHLFYWLFGLAAHGTEHTTGEGVAGELRQQLAGTGVNGYGIATGCDDISGIARDMALLAKECLRLVAGLKRHTDHLGTLGDEKAFFAVETVAKLGFGECTKYFYSRVLE